MQPWEHSRGSRLAGPVGLGVLTLAGVIVLSCIGLAEGTSPILGPVSVLVLALNGGLIALAYLLGAWGLGRPFAAVLARGSSSRVWIQLGLGLAVMLWLSHQAGVMGLLSGPGARPRIVGWGIVAIGIALLADQVARGPLRPERWPVLPASAMLWAPGLALLIVAAASPPGTLWDSEFKAFDTLSYHLQLPKEWGAGTRLWPTDHNVYSYLPSFIEAAFLHLGAMMPGPSAFIRRTLGDDGNWPIACQYLHVGIGIIGAMLTARTAAALARLCGADERASRVLGIIAGAFVLSTPWVIVVSSLAYNDAGVIPLMAAGLLIAMDGGVAPWARGATAGLLVGAACGCKPTALFMAGPVVGLMLLAYVPPRKWGGMIGAGCIAGLVSIAPWMVRNALACGNPVFPFLSGLLGRGRWTQEQIERHARNHHAPPGTGAVERLGRLFSSQVGVLHTQWGIALLVVVLGLAGALIWKPARRAGALLGVGMASQCACWMVLTHLQSRFLLPLIVPAAMLLGLGGAALVGWVRKSGARGPMLAWAALGVLALAPLSQGLRSAVTFLEQNSGRPNRVMPLGVGLLTGTAMEEQLRAAPPEDRATMVADLNPVQYINIIIRPQENPDSGVYLLGDSTPLYIFAAIGDAGAPPGTSKVLYHTTWDTPPIGGDVSTWSAALRRAGAKYVLVNYSELQRLIEMDHYYDPAVTKQKVEAWLTSPDSRLRSVKVWQDGGPGRAAELFEIDLPKAGATGAGNG